MEVSNAVGTTLRTKKITFGDWFRHSEEDRSPDELIVYCLSKMSGRHTVVFNKSYCWSTLRNHMSYSDAEIIERSAVLLIYVGVSKYAIIQTKPKIPYNMGNVSKSGKGGSSKRKKPVVKKQTCRSTARKTTASSTPTRKQPTRTKSRTLSEQRQQKYGIGGAPSSSTSRTRKKRVDYLQLNDGLEEPPETSKSPKPKRRRTYLPSRSGPSTRRQQAQKIVTSPPAQVLASIPSKKNIASPNGISGVQDPTNITNIETATTGNNTPDKNDNGDVEISGVQTNEISGVQTNEPENRSPTLSPIAVSGVQASTIGTRDVLMTATTSVECAETPQLALENMVQTATQSKNNAAIDNTDTLPNLIVNSGNCEPDTGLFGNVPELNTLPPVGDKPPEHLFDGATTEEEKEKEKEKEFDAIDALLSLGTARTNIMEDSEDNSSLMPIVGESHYLDVNPVRVELDQLTVDGAIAGMIENEQNTLVTENANDNVPQSMNKDLISDNIRTEAQTEQDTTDNIDPYKAETEVEESENKHQKKGYVKLTTHGIKKKPTSEGRSYCCAICGVTKRSAHRLNAHHRRKHGAQMCGICPKIFELASSLAHHMYSHDECRYHCEKCSFHSHFESELKKHKVTHHTNPEHQCMHRNCGRWFMRKADLVLHFETHKKNIIHCELCDHTTTLPKYMKEHMKSHGNILPYKCDICDKRFLWRSGVRAHKQREHAPKKNDK